MKLREYHHQHKKQILIVRLIIESFKYDKIIGLLL